MNSLEPHELTAHAVSGPRRHRWGCIAVVLAATLMSACGGDASRSDADKLAEELLNQAAASSSAGTLATDASGTAASAATGDEPGGEPSEGSTGDGTTTPVKVTVDKTVWWGGFKITVSSVEGSSNALGATVNVSFAFENLTDDVGQLSGRDITLTVGTQSYLSGVGQTPTVPAKGRNDGVLDFFIDDTFTAEDAVLTFGQPDSNQAVVPFGSGEATSFEPKALQADAQLVTPSETISLLGGSIDASYAPSEKGMYFIRLAVKATYTAGLSGDLIVPTQFALKSPSGSSFVAAPIAPGDIVAEGIYTGQDLTGRTAAFKVDDVTPGTWAMTFTDNAGQSATADFVVE